MMNHKILRFIPLFFLVITMPLAASASTFSASENYLLPAEKTVPGNVYTAGENVSVAGNILGDLVAGGETVIVNGSVGEDILAGGQSVNILGSVAGDVRAAGGDVVVSGDVSGDVVVAGGSVHVLPDSHIGGDVRILGGSLFFEGSASGTVKVMGGDAAFNGSSAQDVYIKAGTITVGESANISGRLTYSSKEKPAIDDGATILNGVVEESPMAVVPKAENLFDAIFGAFSVTLLFITLLTALVCARFLPQFSNKMYDFSKENFGKSLFVGLAGIILIPILGILLSISVLGLFFGIVTFLGYVIVLIVSHVYAGIFFGAFINGKLLKKEESVTWQSAFLGVVLLTFLGAVPVLGPLLGIIFFLLALGALLQVKYFYFKTLR